MRKNINNLTKELNLLKTKLQQAPPLYELSTKQFDYYKPLISRKNFLETEISKLLDCKSKILKTYSTNNEKWLYDDFLNCRQYCKLEERAAYTRDKKLYKLGFLDSKPVPPIIRKLSSFINTTIIEPANEKISLASSLIKKIPIFQSIKKFTNTTLPNELTNLAISGTKKCIIGYRNLSNSVNYSVKRFSRNVSSSPVIQMLSYIGKQAQKEADLESASFRDRIRVTPHCRYNQLSTQQKYDSDYYLSL